MKPPQAKNRISCDKKSGKSEKKNSRKDSTAEDSTRRRANE